jgi:hypothetical protein
MQDYEIRIRCNGRGYTHIEILYLNDSTAIRAAEILAGGRPFEVWRGLDCIHGTQHMVQPPSPAICAITDAA